ncbi:uncharacterized protein LOC134927157 isoform X3 [Pseudophryne corroboree]|uniref:uncharacterized protein LOC134927157 isoform X3 n=1 Tax=Pseudophryne corroboree TaxID=495146 RepID=UPI00308127E8
MTTKKEKEKDKIKKVTQTSRPDRPQTSQDEAGIAGSASGSRPPVRRPSQGLGHLPRRPSKTRRLGSESAAPSSPTRRRLSAVSPQPPLALLASSQSDEPRSPQLSGMPLSEEKHDLDQVAPLGSNTIYQETARTSHTMLLQNELRRSRLWKVFWINRAKVIYIHPLRKVQLTWGLIQT